MTRDHSNAAAQTASSPQDAGHHLTGVDRERYVESMFDGIAEPYDRLNRVISMGRDRRWRQLAVKMSGARAGDRIADLGCGTGDFAIDFADHVGPDGRVSALDLSPGMLAVAEKKRAGTRQWLTLHRANAAETGLESGWTDVASMGWVLRNVGKRPETYDEILRILKPGGRFVCIDMSRPRGPISRAGFWIYRHLVMRGLVRFAGGNRSAYRYLACSTDGFPDGPELKDELETAGFEDVKWRALMLGALAIHVATKPASRARP